MKIVSYLKVVPPSNKKPEKTELLRKFIQGVNAVGDTGILHDEYNLIDADVAVIQGWQHRLGKSAPHLQLRQQIVNTQNIKKKKTCIADSNLFLYANSSNEPHHYLRYSFDGVFPNTGNYFDSVVDPNRWKQISKDLGISLDPVKTKGKYILFCLQRDGGWSMGNLQMIPWIIKTIKEIREHSDRKIVLRTHPGDKNSHLYVAELKKLCLKDVAFSSNASLDEDLRKAWCVVNHNSSSIVGPIIRGYSAFVTDPVRSQCSEVAHSDFSLIESPLHFDREKWVQRLAMSHWKFSELEDGSAWSHMRNFVQ